MPQFDVYRLRSGALVLDVQSDLIRDWDTRLVVPLVPPDEDARPTDRLNPQFDVDGEPLVMATQLAAAVFRRELGDPILSFAQHEYQVKAALDMLISGF